MPRTLYEDHATATGQYTPSAAVDDFTLLIEIADLPAEWKAAVKSDGADIRVHDDFNNELPHDLIEWTYVSPTNVTGWIRCKYEGELDVAPVVKVYAGDANATAYDVDYGKGQYATYDLAYYFPMSDDNDRTANPINIATNKGVAAAGKIGGGLYYDPAGASFSNFATSKLSAASGTISAWFKTNTSVASGFIFSAAGVGVERTYLYTQYYSSAQHLTIGIGNSSSLINVVIPDTDGIWNHAAMTWDGTNAKLFHNGTQVGSTTAYSGLTAIQNPGYIGHLSNGNEIDAVLDELILAPTDLSAAWVDFEYKQTNDNADFWDSSWTWVGSSVPIDLGNSDSKASVASDASAISTSLGLANADSRVQVASDASAISTSLGLANADSRVQVASDASAITFTASLNDAGSQVRASSATSPLSITAVITGIGSQVAVVSEQSDVTEGGSSVNLGNADSKISAASHPSFVSTSFALDSQGSHVQSYSDSQALSIAAGLSTSESNIQTTSDVVGVPIQSSLQNSDSHVAVKSDPSNLFLTGGNIIRLYYETLLGV